MARAKKKPTESQPAPPPAGFAAPPSDAGLSIDKLAQAFAAMMGAPDPRAAEEAEVVEVNASPDLDADEDPAAADEACRVSPLTILEALLFVGLAGGKPLSSRTVAGGK